MSTRRHTLRLSPRKSSRDSSEGRGAVSNGDEIKGEIFWGAHLDGSNGYVG